MDRDRRGARTRPTRSSRSTRSTPACTRSTRAWLRSRIGTLSPSPKTGELYLTELIELARADGRVVVALTVEDDGRLIGINDRAELAQAEWDLRTRINAAHMRAGVTMRDPSTVYARRDRRRSPRTSSSSRT